MEAQVSEEQQGMIDSHYGPVALMSKAYSNYRVKPMTETYRIGDLARLTDTKVVTIRYYERIGLMPEPRAQRRELPRLCQSAS